MTQSRITVGALSLMNESKTNVGGKMSFFYIMASSFFPLRAKYILPFRNTTSCCPLYVLDQGSQPHKTASKFITLYILILSFYIANENR